jgi:AcrR family transcriptional regulator
MKKKPPKTYHHGDLRETLVKAGRTILEKEGAAALTLRACARKAGVSHAAPQHHFASVADLLAEIAATGFEDFASALDAGSASALSPTDKLKEMGRSYVAFAHFNPAIYDLMFGVGIPLTSERLLKGMTSAWDLLATAVRAVAGPDDVESKATHVWSTVHGFSTLMMAHRLPPMIDSQRALESVIARLPEMIKS